VKLELDTEKSNKNIGKIIKLRRLIHNLAYGSLILDILIAIITSLSIFQISNPTFLLGPINVMLTIVVILSIGSGILIITFEHYEKILLKTLHIKERIKDKIAVLVSSRNKYKFHPR